MTGNDPLDPSRFTVSQWQQIASLAAAKGDTKTADLATHLGRRAMALEPIAEDIKPTNSATVANTAQFLDSASGHTGKLISGLARAAGTIEATPGAVDPETHRPIPRFRGDPVSSFRAGEAGYDADLANATAGHNTALGGIGGALALALATGGTSEAAPLLAKGSAYLPRLLAALKSFGTVGAVTGGTGAEEGHTLEGVAKGAAENTAAAMIPATIGAARGGYQGAKNILFDRPSVTPPSEVPTGSGWKPTDIDAEPKPFSLRTLGTRPADYAQEGSGEAGVPRRQAPIIRTDRPQGASDIAPPEGFEPTGQGLGNLSAAQGSRPATALAGEGSIPIPRKPGFNLDAELRNPIQGGADASETGGPGAPPKPEAPHMGPGTETPATDAGDDAYDNPGSRLRNTLEDMAQRAEASHAERLTRAKMLYADAMERAKAPAADATAVPTYDPATAAARRAAATAQNGGVGRDQINDAARAAHALVSAQQDLGSTAASVEPPSFEESLRQTLEQLRQGKTLDQIKKASGQ